MSDFFKNANPIGLAMSGLKILGGGIQALSGRRILRRTKLPGYDIPEEFEQNLAIARDIKTMDGMPVAQYERGTMEIGRNALMGMNALRGRRAATAGVSAVVQRAMDAQGNLDIASANMARQSRMVGTQMEMGANAALAGQRLQKQSWEKFQPYMRRMAEGQALVGSGLQNMFGGASDMSTMAMYDRYFQNQRGNKTSPYGDPIYGGAVGVPE